MRMLQRNKSKMWYALYTQEQPIYEMKDGQVVTIKVDGVDVPVIKGRKPAGYSDLTEFKAVIATSGGVADSTEYGVDVSSYSATMVTKKGYIPICEDSLIWTTEPTPNSEGLVDGKTADYRVKKVSPSLNFTEYILEKVVK